MNRPAQAYSIAERLKRYFKLGTDRRRGWYEASKRVLNFKTFANRRRSAEMLADNAGFEIDRELGFCGLRPDEHGEADGIVGEVRRYMSRIDPLTFKQPQLTTTGLFVHLLSAKQIQLSSPFLRFVLRPELLAVVSNYLGIIPVLAQIDLWYSVHHGVINNSHYYHCDWSAQSQIKIFVYCSDVGSDNGPLTIVEAQASRRIRARLGYDYNRHGTRYRVTDQRMRELCPADAEHVLLGRSGSTFLADTSQCFHYGSRVAAGAEPRVVLMYQLIPPSAFQLPLRFKYGAPFSHLAHPHLPVWQRQLLGGE